MNRHIHDVIIVGAGLGGIAAAINLMEQGVSDYVILERSDGVGGTWRRNSYPGCGCDTQMVAYQFSFSLNHDWDSLYPKAPQILEYAEQVAEGFGINSHLRLGTTVQTLVWNDDDSQWVVHTDQGDYAARSVFMALGQFASPAIPALPGRADFAGPAFHSADWDHSVDLSGKRVAVVGSAASAIQLIPEVAEVASEVLVFQRTPNWIIPRGDREVPALERELLAEQTDAVRLNREFQLANADALIWPIFSFTDRARKYFTDLATKHLHAQVNDPDLRNKLTPSYPVGCKRLLLSDDYYPTLMLDHVSMFDQGVAGLRPSGVVDATGVERKVDVVVWATGFDSRGWQTNVPVQGRGGATLASAWEKSPQTLLGAVVPGLPNFFLAYGPNTNLGHGPVTYMLERQAEFFARIVSEMDASGLSSVEVRQDAVDAWQAVLHDRLAASTWADPSCASYYKTDDGLITKNWMGSMQDYREALAAIALDSFHTTRADFSEAG